MLPRLQSLVRSSPHAIGTAGRTAPKRLPVSVARPGRYPARAWSDTSTSGCIADGSEFTQNVCVGGSKNAKPARGTARLSVPHHRASTTTTNGPMSLPAWDGFLYLFRPGVAHLPEIALLA